MIEYLGHKFIPYPSSKYVDELKYHKCDTCGRKAFLYNDNTNEWHYWKYYSNGNSGIRIGSQEKLMLNCVEEQIKRMLE